MKLIYTRDTHFSQHTHAHRTTTTAATATATAFCQMCRSFCSCNTNHVICFVLFNLINSMGFLFTLIKFQSKPKPKRKETGGKRIKRIKRNRPNEINCRNKINFTVLRIDQINQYFTPFLISTLSCCFCSPFAGCDGFNGFGEFISELHSLCSTTIMFRA